MHLINHDEETLKNEKLLHQLLLRVEELKKDTTELFSDLNMSAEQFAAYVQNKENFSPAEWEIFQQQQKQLDEKLSLSLEGVRNPQKAKQSFQDLNLSRNWLFVK